MIKKIKKGLTPSKILLMSFIIIILIGTFFLSLPVAIRGGDAGVFEALFTATSAVSVTGLSIVDVSKTYTTFGWVVILILIQLGGLGIMTFSSVLMMLIGKKITYEEKKILKEDLNRDGLGGIIRFIKRIMMIVFSIELIGAVLLFFSFIKSMSIEKAIFYSVFHSVSAFCNAGFSLFSTGLEGFKDDYLVNVVISALIILGGIGFAVINSYIVFFLTKRKKFNLTSKLAIRISVILLLAGTILFYILEYGNSLADLTFLEKIVASFFQSVTTRTAGFNTVSMAELRPATGFMFLLLMFIGASPGSTGGGIKTTTFGVILYYVVGIVRNRDEVTIENRRISWQILNRALAILVISLLYVCAVSMILLFIEDISFMEIVFEVFSAFATVGLSMGITASLAPASKVLIIITMLVGRVGPLTFALAFGEKNRQTRHKYPIENILVG